MSVEFYSGTTVGKFHVRAVSSTRDRKALPREDRTVVVRHTVGLNGGYYEEVLSQRQALQLGIALLRDYSLNEFDVG